MAKQLARKSLLTIIYRALIPILSLITLVLVKRYLGFEAVGLMAFAISFVSLFSFISDLGLSNAHTKISNESALNKAKCNRAFVTMKLVLSFATVLVILSSIYLYIFFFNYEYESSIILTLILLAIVRLFLLNLKSIFVTISTSKTEMAAAVVPGIIFSFIKAILKISFLLAGFEIASIIGAEIIALVFLLILYLRYVKFELGNFDWGYFKKYIAFALPLTFISFVLVYGKSIDKVMLQYFIGSEAVGIYVIPQRILEVTLIVSSGVITLLFPEFSRLYNNNNMDKIQQLMDKSVKYISLCLCPIYIFLFLFGYQILGILFGQDSTVSYPFLGIFIIIAYLNSIRLPYSLQLVASGKLKYSFWLSFLTLLINTLLNLYFIPKHFNGFNTLGLGAIGAAYTTLLVISINLVLIIVISHKKFEINFYFSVFKHILTSLLICLIIMFSGLNITSSIFILILCPFIIGLLFFSIMYLIKEIDSQDINLIKNTINPIYLFSYMKTMK